MTVLRRPRRRRGLPPRPYRLRRRSLGRAIRASAPPAVGRPDVRMIDAAGQVIELHLPPEGPLNLSR